MSNVDKWTRKMLRCAEQAEEAHRKGELAETLDWFELAFLCFEKAADESRRDEQGS